MRVIACILVSVFLLVMTIGCAQRRIIYEGPTPTNEIKIVKDKSCN